MKKQCSPSFAKLSAQLQASMASPKFATTPSWPSFFDPSSPNSLNAASEIHHHVNGRVAVESNDHIQDLQEHDADFVSREQFLREAFDVYATTFCELVRDHALLTVAPGQSMMQVYLDNIDVLRTMPDALATPRLPASRAPETWALAGRTDGLTDPIDLLPLPSPREIPQEAIERDRQTLPDRVADLLRNHSQRGTPTLANFRWGIVVPVGWVHVQNVEGMESDALPGGTWIYKYRRKLGLKGEEVSGHCAAIGGHTNGFTTPVGAHVFCFEASKFWLEKEGRLRRFHFIIPLCPAHHRSNDVGFMD
ncbi:hypothetical protein HDU86_000934 [Geranomyces michiganensis]|nr:hypothetical protein HDU86_000934 [Geranomyces michiganensis]